MKRRPNHVASMLPVSSSRRAIVRWILPPEALDADVADGRLGRNDRSVELPAELADRVHLAQVVISPGQVEEQVADGVEAEPDARPPKRRASRQSRRRQRGRQQRSPGRSVAAGAGDRRLGHLFGGDQVPVERLAAVAHLDLDARQ